MTSPPTPIPILYVVNDLALGGAQRVLLGQASGLDRARWAPEVASLELDPCGALVRAFAAAGVPVRRLRRASEPPAAGLPRLIQLVRRRRPAIVHTHLAAAGIAGRVAARFARGTRTVSTVHNLSDWLERAAHPLRRLDRVGLARADAVLAVSDAVRRCVLARAPGLAPRLRTLRNGIDVAAFATTAAQRAAARAACGYAPGEVVVGAVARLEARKGIDVLLHAAARAARAGAPLRLHVVGDGPERGALEALGRSLGTHTFTRWLGHQADVHPQLAACDLVAAPSRSEGLGLSVIEALAAGVPVLGADVGGIPELLSGAPCARLLPPGDAVAWAEALSALARDTGARARMSAAAPAWAARFSLAASIAALEQAYDDVLAAVPARLREAA